MPGECASAGVWHGGCFMQSHTTQSTSTNQVSPAMMNLLVTELSDADLALVSGGNDDEWRLGDIDGDYHVVEDSGSPSGLAWRKFSEEGE